MVTLTINGQTHDVDMAPDTPLLWALRDGLSMNGTKYGCGIAQCGACTVLLDGNPVRSCVTPLSSASGKQITTIEGLSKDHSHPVQQAWIAEQVPQCGYCQSGQILAVSALLSKTPQPTDADIDDALRGILCRCGTYTRIRKAIKKAVELAANNTNSKGGEK